MQTETIELLSGKGHFSMEQALTLAEALDGVIEKTQLVTVPILDARLAPITARIDTLEARLDARIDSVEAKLSARIDSVEARLGGRMDAMGAKLDAHVASMDAKFERWTIRIIIAMVLAQTAAGPIGMRVFDSMRQVIGH